jgi:uncharacterized lipoprotein YajG
MKTLKIVGDNKITISDEFADVFIMDNDNIKDVLNSLKNDLINKFMEISSVGSVIFGINSI